MLHVCGPGLNWSNQGFHRPIKKRRFIFSMRRGRGARAVPSSSTHLLFLQPVLREDRDEALKGELECRSPVPRNPPGRLSFIQKVPGPGGSFLMRLNVFARDVRPLRPPRRSENGSAERFSSPRLRDPARLIFHTGCFCFVANGRKRPPSPKGFGRLRVCVSVFGGVFADDA